ncbi:hypothetical protein PENTCL1PPCAC_10896, partial [Pristionchus entomophagus]
EFALQRVNIIKSLKVVYKGYQIVDNRIELAEIVEGEEIQENDSTTIQIKMVVYETMERIFELRLKLLQTSLDLTKLRK